jgi:hypothetical protein
MKDFRFNDRHALQFRTEWFNAFNHPAWGAPISKWGSNGQTPCAEFRAHPVHHSASQHSVCFEVLLLSASSGREGFNSPP